MAFILSVAISSTKLVTDQDGNVIQGATRYYAYGREQTPGRLAGLPTDYTFTGQRQDNTGLIYMNARYYDPELGQFISPDTEIPDATNVFDYNRYMYARGNPIRYSDPDGHCATLPSGASDENDGECWRYANTILAQWDNTPDYWNERFYSKDNFLYVAANSENHADGFQNAFMQYLGSDAYKAWAAKQPSQSVAHAEAADPMCAGQAACQALVQHANQVSEPVAAYCQAHDCAGIAIDSVGTLSAAGVAVACIPGFAVCGTVAYVGTSIGIATGGLSIAHTADLVSKGRANEADLYISVATFVVGSIGPFNKLAPVPSAIVGAGASIVQMGWDHWASELVAKSFPPYHD